MGRRRWSRSRCEERARNLEIVATESSEELEVLESTWFPRRAVARLVGRMVVIMMMLVMIAIMEQEEEEEE